MLALITLLCAPIHSHNTQPCLPSPRLAPAALAPKPADEIRQYLAACEFFGWSGVAIVEHKGRIILHEGYGLSDRAAGRPNDRETVFEIASATKPITAAAILALVEDGKVDLDTSISKYLPNVPDDKAGITPRHLLNHTSGMARSVVGGCVDIEAAIITYLGPSPARKPGAAHEYWNGGYALLSAIIERQSGMGYMDYCRQRLFVPAGLEVTGFTGDELWPAEEQAVGYDGSKKVRRAAGHPYGDAYDYAYRGMGGVVTSAAELHRLGKAILQGKVLKKSTVKSMVTPSVGSYGLGWGVTQTKGKIARISHGGDVKGFHTQALFYPKAKTAIVLVSNVDHVPMWHLSWNIEALLFGAAPPYPMPPHPGGGRPQTKGTAGTYRLASGGSLEVVSSDLGLELIPHGLDATLALIGERESAATKALCKEALEILSAALESRPDDISSRLAPGIPGSWPTMLVRSIVPDHLKAWGPVESTEVVHCARAGTGNGECTVALHHSEGTSFVRIALRKGRLQIFDLQASRPESHRRFGVPPAPKKKPKGGPKFKSFVWAAVPGKGGNPSTLRFEMKGRQATQLMLDTGSGRRMTAMREAKPKK